MRLALTIFAILTLIALAWRLGRGPERVAAGILGANFVLTICNKLLRGPVDFSHVDPVLAGIDFLTLVGLTTVALQANRLWPLLVSALQLLVIFAHFSVMISVGRKQVYWGMMAFAQYLQLLTVASGAITQYFRERRRGPCRSWRPGTPNPLGWLPARQPHRPPMRTATPR